MSQLSPPAHDEFELGRRQRETTNERAICLIRAGFLLLAMAGQLIVRSLPDVAVKPPLALPMIEGIAAVLSVIFWSLLRGEPTYRPLRKYGFLAFDLLIMVSLILSARAIGESAFNMVATIPAFMIVILLAGLRYSSRAVVVAGVVTTTLHVLLAVTAPDRRMLGPALVMGMVILVSATLIVGRLVESLLTLHRQAVSRGRLRRFLPPEVVDEVERAPEVALGAVEREVTVIFSDISGFTKMSSGMEPKEIVRLLNDYFPRMVAIVFRHGGTLEKYIGDALLAVWGAPVPYTDAADRALAAAIDMQREVVELNAEWEAAGRRTIDIHIGIHTGRVAAGHIGTEDYIQYACIGDTTNVSSRVCGVAEEAEIVISTETKERLEQEYPLVALEPVKVKGKEEALQLFRVDWTSVSVEG